MMASGNGLDMDEDGEEERKVRITARTGSSNTQEGRDEDSDYEEPDYEDNTQESPVTTKDSKKFTNYALLSKFLN